MVSSLIWDRINLLDEFEFSQNNEESEDFFNIPTQHITLGSKEKPISFSDLETLHLNDSAFRNFRMKLNNFLTIFLQTLSVTLPDNKPIHFKSNDKVFSNFDSAF